MYRNALESQFISGDSDSGEGSGHLSGSGPTDGSSSRSSSGMNKTESAADLGLPGSSRYEWKMKAMKRKKLLGRVSSMDEAQGGGGWNGKTWVGADNSRSVWRGGNVKRELGTAAYYLARIAAWTRVFPRSSMYIVTVYQLVNDTKKTMQGLADFLDLQSDWDRNVELPDALASTLAALLRKSFLSVGTGENHEDGDGDGWSSTEGQKGGFDPYLGALRPENGMPPGQHNYTISASPSVRATAEDILLPQVGMTPSSHSSSEKRKAGRSRRHSRQNIDNKSSGAGVQSKPAAGHPSVLSADRLGDAFPSINSADSTDTADTADNADGTGNRYMSCEMYRKLLLLYQDVNERLSTVLNSPYRPPGQPLFQGLLHPFRNSCRQRVALHSPQ